jgi:uncharacterized protein DUF1194
LSETPLQWNPEHTNPPGGLDHYYRTNVIGGPGAFVMAAKNFETFGDAIISKLIAEVAQMREPQLHEPNPQPKPHETKPRQPQYRQTAAR